MSSNFEIPPQELYVDWPEQPWPRLPGQLGRKQLRRELPDVLKHLSNKAKLRIGPSGAGSKKVHYACESGYTRLTASDCVALAAITRKRLEAGKPAGYCGHIAPKPGRIHPDKPNCFTQFWKRPRPAARNAPLPSITIRALPASNGLPFSPIWLVPAKTAARKIAILA